MKKTCALLIVIFWAVMTGLLVRREVIPNLVRRPPVGYKPSQAREVGEKRHRMGVYIGDQRVGQADTLIKTYPDGSRRIESRTNVNIGFIGPTRLTLNVFVQSNAKLSSFHARMDSPLYKTRILGRAKGDELIVLAETGGKTTRMSVPLRSDTIVSGNMFPLVDMPRLRVGDQWEVSFLDPLTLTTSVATARVESKGKKLWQGRETDAWLVIFSYSGFEVKAWIDSRGEILEQSALGVVMKREEIGDDTDEEPNEEIR